jgi:hypothetical protein
MTYTTNDTEASCVGNGGSQLGASRNVHTSQEHRMLDPEEIGGCCSKLLGGRHLDVNRIAILWRCESE